MSLDATRLRDRVMASDAQHSGYLRDVREYLTVHRVGMEEGAQGSVRAASLRKSVLFGREYLVLCVDDEVVAARGADAFVADRSGVGYGHRPPAVFIPTSARRRRTTAFRAVLEHEFVHVNQCLLGRAFAQQDPHAATEYRIRLMNEFEAYALQNITWPHAVSETRLSPTRRALVSAQETALRAMLNTLANMPTGEQAALPVLAAVRPTAVDVLEGLGVPHDDVRWLLRRVQTVTAQLAAEVLGGPDAPAPAQHVLGVVARWACEEP